MALWFRPVCDQLLVKIQAWHDKYHRGEVYSTRLYANPIGVVEAIPQLYLHRVPLRPLELKNLVTIMQELAPKSKVTKDLVTVHEQMGSRFSSMPVASRPKLMMSGEWVIPLAYYQDDIKGIIDVLLRARDNRQSMEEIQNAKKDEGKSLFEV